MVVSWVVLSCLMITVFLNIAVGVLSKKTVCDYISGLLFVVTLGAVIILSEENLLITSKHFYLGMSLFMLFLASIVIKSIIELKNIYKPKA